MVKIALDFNKSWIIRIRTKLLVPHTRFSISITFKYINKIQNKEMKRVIDLILYLIKNDIVLRLNIIVFFYYLFLKHMKLVTDKKMRLYQFL
jgi:hypothetical protein